MPDFDGAMTYVELEFRGREPVDPDRLEVLVGAAYARLTRDHGRPRMVVHSYKPEPEHRKRVLGAYVGFVPELPEARLDALTDALRASLGGGLHVDWSGQGETAYLTFQEPLTITDADRELRRLFLEQGLKHVEVVSEKEQVRQVEFIMAQNLLRSEGEPIDPGWEAAVDEEINRLRSTAKDRRFTVRHSPIRGLLREVVGQDPDLGKRFLGVISVTTVSPD